MNSTIYADATEAMIRVLVDDSLDARAEFLMFGLEGVRSSQQLASRIERLTDRWTEADQPTFSPSSGRAVMLTIDLGRRDSPEIVQLFAAQLPGLVHEWSSRGVSTVVVVTLDRFHNLFLGAMRSANDALDRPIAIYHDCPKDGQLAPIGQQQSRSRLALRARPTASVLGRIVSFATHLTANPANGDSSVPEFRQTLAKQPFSS